MARRASFLDRALGAVGLQRRRQAGGFASSYAGAKTGSLYADFIMAPLSADEAAKYDLQALRARAREVVINDAVGARIPTLFSENVVGEHGFTLQVNVGTTRGERNTPVSSKVERAFYDWAENYCTVDGRLDFVDVQTLAAESEPVDGEFVARHVRGADNPYGYALELIDPDQLDHRLNVRASTADGASIRMGVEVDRWRRPLRYWLLKQHPSEGGARDYLQVPAADLIHLYVSKRVGQTRGVTWLAPVLLNLKMLSGGREAVLVAMRAAACNSVMFEVDPEHPGYQPPAADPSGAPAKIPTDLEPGAGYELPPGITAKFNSPPFADSAFDPFEKGILRTSGGAVGFSYASLSGDVTQASYGSQRAALLPEQAFYRKLQRRLDRRFLTPVYREWVGSALLSGALSVDSFEPKRYWTVAWHPRPFEWIDPLKDAEAEDTKVGMGVQTATRIAAAGGDDFKTLIDERAAEIAYARSKGVPLFVGGVDVTGQFQQTAGKGSSTATGDTQNGRQDQKVEAPTDSTRALRVVHGGTE